MNELINDGQPFFGSFSTELGLSPKALRRLLASGRLRRVLRGVYVDTLVADTREVRANAVRLVKPPHAVFYGATAAFLLGVDVFPPKDRFNLTPQCVVPHHQVRCPTPSVRCREGYLPQQDLETINGLVITNAVRTTVDLLRTLWRPHALAAADAMAHAGLVTPEEVRAYIKPMRRYPGIVQARALAPLIEPKAESPGESWQRLRLVDAGFPVPEAQIELSKRPGVLVAVLDNGYRGTRVGLDYDGREFHEDDLKQEKDHDKRDYCSRVLGWRLKVAKHADIFGDNPAYEQQVGEWLGITPLPRRW